MVLPPGQGCGRGEVIRARHCCGLLRGRPWRRGGGVSSLDVFDTFPPMSLKVGAETPLRLDDILNYVWDAPPGGAAPCLGLLSMCICDVVCDAGCPIKRYLLDVADFSLALAVEAETPAPTSEWIYVSGGGLPELQGLQGARGAGVIFVLCRLPCLCSYAPLVLV